MVRLLLLCEQSSYRDAAPVRLRVRAEAPVQSMLAQLGALSPEELRCKSVQCEFDGQPGASPENIRTGPRMQFSAQDLILTWKFHLNVPRALPLLAPLPAIGASSSTGTGTGTATGTATVAEPSRQTVTFFGSEFQPRF